MERQRETNNAKDNIEAIEKNDSKNAQKDKKKTQHK